MSNPYAPPDPDRPRPPEPSALPPTAPVVQPEVPSDPDGTQHARRLVNTTFLLVIAGLIVQFFPAPWNVASIVFASVALVYAMRATFVGRRAQVDRMTLLAAGVLVFTAGSGLLVGTTSLMLLPAQMELDRCQVGALTEAGKQSCTQAFEDAVNKLQKQLSGPSLRP
ncbi:MAG: hypothetical protein FWF02_05105 [Micrococcales bacterium]|nr:hypothetical protein [Micrococcales bacterium]MCL2667071.1 hypothetical protein [Micrococcales bacterium]